MNEKAQNETKDDGEDFDLAVLDLLGKILERRAGRKPPGQEDAEDTPLSPWSLIGEVKKAASPPAKKPAAPAPKKGGEHPMHPMDTYAHDGRRKRM